MELFEHIRRDRREDGVSIRGLARRHRVHRRTVRQALRSALPPPRKPASPSAPRLGAHRATIREWLVADLSAPRKQRHTARRIWQRLVDERGASVAESTVRAYAGRVRRELESGRVTVTIPQLHPPGEEAEVDFGGVSVWLDGVLTELSMFVMRLSHSGRAVHVCFPGEGQEAFLEGHTLAFGRLGGVPRRVRYDNLKAAVTRVLAGRDRIESDRFAALRSHFGFDAFFCEPGAGGAHEKTPQDAKGSSSEVLVVGTVSPGGRLVVGQAALQAAVQVADEAVGEGAQRLVVEVAGGAPPVVEVTAARAHPQRAQRPLAGGVVEPPVADEAGPHCSLAAGCYRQRRGTGVVPAGLRRVVAFGVIPELAEHPGAEDHTETGQGTVDAGVRVLLKMARELGIELLDLTVDLADHPHCRAGARRVRLAHHGRRLELGGAQRLADRGGAPLDVALAAAAPERGADLGDAQPRRLARAGRGGQHAHRIAVGEFREGLQCTRKVLPERVAQPVGLADAVPDQLLVGAGEDAHRAGLVAVAGDRPVVVAVGADEVGEQPGVAGVGLGAAGVVALAVARRRARVDGVDAVAGRDQRRDPGAAVGLDADHDLAGPGGVLCDQFVQSGDPRDALGQPPGGESLAGFVHELDVVVVLGPVVAHIQDHRPVLLRFEPLDIDPMGESQRRPNGTVLDGTTPHECCGTTQEYQPGLGLLVAVQKPRGGMRDHRLAGSRTSLPENLWPLVGTH